MNDTHTKNLECIERALLLGRSRSIKSESEAYRLALAAVKDLKQNHKECGRRLIRALRESAGIDKDICRLENEIRADAARKTL